MEKINFIGAYDKTDSIMYIAKILTEMKKKVIKGARKLIKKLFEAILDREAFIFEAPRAFTRNFSRDMLTDDQLEVIDDWKAAVRGQLNTAEKLHADKRGLADHGDTYFEILPLPAPNIIVMCDKCLIRYEIEVFAYKKRSPSVGCSGSGQRERRGYRRC